MHADFHLVDLVSQATAVQSLLRGKSADEKIEWLSSHGSIIPVPNQSPNQHQSFRFESQTRVECAFFLDGDEFVFFGDHTTFTASDSR